MAATVCKLSSALFVMVTSLLCLRQVHGQACVDSSPACAGWAQYCDEQHKTVLILCRATCNTCGRDFSDHHQKAAIKNQQEANAKFPVARRQFDRTPVDRTPVDRTPYVHTPGARMRQSEARRMSESRREAVIRAEQERLRQWRGIRHGGGRDTDRNNRLTSDSSAASRAAAQREEARRAAARRESERVEALQRENARRQAAHRETQRREAQRIQALQRENARRQEEQREAARREEAQREAARRDQIRQAEERRRSGVNRRPVVSSQYDSSTCKDDNPGCPYWTRFCTQAYSQVLQQCRKACGVCTDRQSSSSWRNPSSPRQVIDLFDRPLEGCKDDYPACPQWGEYCTERYTSVRKYCRATCNTCHENRNTGTDFWFVDKSRREFLVERMRRTHFGDSDAHLGESDDEDNLGTEGSGGRMP